MKLHLWALAALTLTNTHAVAAAPGESCVQDLRAIGPFLLENDTGARAHLAQKGQAYFDLALASASEAAENTNDESACNVVLANYLSKWRTGHLQIVPSTTLKHSKPAPPSTPTATATANTDQREPSLQLLSPRTALLTLPSFFPRYSNAIADLLTSKRHDLATRPNWIIDVRLNNGGSDSTYAPLLPWISSGEIVSVGGEWLSTPANIAGQEDICALFAPGDTSCTTYSEHAVARMRSVASGQFVTQQADGPVSYGSFPRKKMQPARVAVLVDRDCASSCEEFLLAARQSFHVKLIGRNSNGTLDYSNLRLHALPSGIRQLMYATSRSARLPQLQVDLGGIMPDIYLPPPKDEAERAQEIVRVQRWLEGGSLR
ncbi:S41 family peptidase [Janthinobacterium sp. DSP2-3-3]|uniref:S41 family peptidase n=1 Tax=Janthinobacterium sp. DSP2-3-3 TaxID=2804596 RepID=UPI003CEF89D4